MNRKTLIAAAAIVAVPVAAAGIALFPDREGASPPVPEPVPAEAVFTRAQIGRAVAAPTPAAGRTVAPQSAAPADDGQWVMPAKDYAATRFSALGEINPANAKNLQEVFSFSLGVDKGQEAAPLVVGSTMYVVSAFPNYVYALDLRRNGALKWKYAPKPLPAAAGVACCDVVNRGAAFADGKIVFNTLDGQTIALDAETGKPRWKTRLADINKGETITMAPLIAGGKVLVGDSGGEFGVHGWLTALDLGTGKIAWRAYHTGPDDQVLIGKDFHPFYAADRGKNLGVSTWPPDAWKIGGGSMWGWIAFDPAANTIYYGTANPGPWNAQQRPGDNKWTAGIFARDIATGQAKWFYQFSPHDQHDYDAINEQILLDMPFAGKMRPVIFRAERNGYVYILDRNTGQVLSADPFGPVNSSKGVDLRTGRLVVNPEKETKLGQVIHDICPTASGAKDWNPSAFSPRTGLIYIPHENLCMDWMNLEVNYIAGTPYVGAEVKMKPGPGGHRGVLTAWDPVMRRPAWEVKEDLPVWSGAVATGGDLVFYGTMDGSFKALDARTGKLVWQKKLPSGIIGQPISYRGPDGHQYVAVLSGVGGWAGAIVSGALDPRDGSSALGFVNTMTDLVRRTTAGGTLHVFALPH
ncbi:methanol/ethanol family PQQ-dependent dehydrogenase [Sphingomonas quercus]|uniref:Methanol/ethanol family PQQ-dependent dehydrogenase n=1 Tax=Sphingomonas quercus TaxID=2842451 RepID=A0ABS6BLZ6_9SPHN|nr:methanol/ethanol family PQQ-dependent dehydrogenase [Sphingomonas quercus]MBU3079348.1 methanol/ethanol family PQQ-dependent dehydrogenase [Sphingomonas quercus]